MEEADPDVRDLPLQVDDNDLDIREDVCTALRYNSETAHLTDIDVQVVDGIVTVRGTVTDSDDIALVYAIVKELEGVKEVRSELEVDV
jgi:osmotically-inducible protein OsmY